MSAWVRFIAGALLASMIVRPSIPTGTSMTVFAPFFTQVSYSLFLICREASSTSGVWPPTPDVEDASRQIKKSEYDTCVKNGAKTVIEVPVGIDGLTIIEANNAPAMNLTQADIYKALAANPFGRGPNKAQTWKDVNPSLPAIKIRVLGPPPTSGTRDSLADLYLTKGCDTDPAIKALGKSDEERHKEICTKIREDGA